MKPRDGFDLPVAAPIFAQALIVIGIIAIISVRAGSIIGWMQ